MKTSVIMSVKNGGEYVEDAIESILKQNIADFEFLIAADGADQETVDTLFSFTDPRVHITCHKESLGLATRLNELMEAAKGEFIARMDADDIAEPYRLEKQVKFLTDNPDISVCGSWAHVLGTSKKICTPLTNDTISDYMFFSPALIHPTVMWKRKDLESHKLSYPIHPCAQDYGFWLNIQKEGLKIANIPEELLQYRIHAGSTTHNTHGNPKTQVLKEVMTKHFDYFLNAEQIQLNARIATGQTVTLKEAILLNGSLCFKIFKQCTTQQGRTHCIKRYIKTLAKAVLAA